MDYRVAVIELPSRDVFYRRGKLNDYVEIPDFVKSSTDMCKTFSPNTEIVEGGYRYVSFPVKPETGKPVDVEFAIEVRKPGSGSGDIGFKTLAATDAVGVRHKGPYDEMGDAYTLLVNWMFSNGIRASEPPRECYIKGPWEIRNKHEWITEIQIPAKLPDSLKTSR